MNARLRKSLDAWDLRAYVYACTLTMGPVVGYITVSLSANPVFNPYQAYILLFSGFALMGGCGFLTYRMIRPYINLNYGKN